MAIAGDLTAGREMAPPERRGFDPKWIFIAVSVAIVAYLGLVPLVFLLWQSFLTPQSAAAPAQYTLENFRTSVHVVDTRGVDVELPASPPNQTARYGEPGYALILERGTALWMVSGKRPVNCKQESDPA